MIVSRQSLSSLLRRFAALVHTHVKADVTDLENIGTAPAIDRIPKAGGSGLLDYQWNPRTSVRGSSNLYLISDETGGVDGDLVNDDTLPVDKIHATVADVFFGRDTAGAGGGEEISAAAARAILNVADGANAYVHPNHSGDVTSVADGAQTIANGVVTNAKLADMAQGTVKVRLPGAGTGSPTDATLSSTKGANRVPIGDANGSFDEEFVRPSTGIGMFVTNAAGVVKWTNRTAGVATGVPLYKTDGGDMVFSRYGDTVFPVSPADGQWCTRTDLGNTMFEYCSAKSAWLSVNVYEITFAKRAASVTSGNYFAQLLATGAADYSATYGERFGFDVIVVGIAIEVGASSTCTATAQDDGVDVTGGAISLAAETVKQDETLLSNTIAAGSVIGVKCTSGTASTFTNGKVRLRRIAT